MCTMCGERFSTVTGLGVHVRFSHPDEHDRLHLRKDKKARWCDEEMRLLARKEAELILRGDVRFFNKELSSIFQERTLESIKKARQKITYKELVTQYKLQLEADISNQPSTSHSSDAPSTGRSPIEQTTDSYDQFILYTLSQPRPRDRSYNSRCLQSIVERALDVGKDDTLISLSSYLLEILPVIVNPNPPGRRQQLVEQRVSKKERRRQEYATVQKYWSYHQGRCIESILDGPNRSILPPRMIVEPFWRSIMEAEPGGRSGWGTSPPQTVQQLWSPITIEEVSTSRVPVSKGSGPDNISPRQLKSIPSDILMRIFNIILWCEKCPSHITSARTVLIPKKPESIDPGDFRPITVPSVFLRQLHSILARRVAALVALDVRQKAFQASDGCAENITLIDMLLRYHHGSYASCYIASLDVSKAFDSVSHSAIFGILRAHGIPDGFIRYLGNLYRSSSTKIHGDGWTSDSIYPKRGVKQGDPLSPILFNIVIDKLLSELPTDVGCNIGCHKINALAFADDLVLCASTPRGLQSLLDKAFQMLNLFGMVLNSDKCITISIKGQPKQKRTIIEQKRFSISGRPIKALKRTDQWKYLGVNFSPEGRCKVVPHQSVQPKLDRLTKAPLKPQQRLHVLRTVLIPQLYYGLTLGNVMIGSLNKVDRVIRSAVRTWLKLPGDVTTAFFHASVQDGGLGIPSLRWQAPLLRRDRLRGIKWRGLEEIREADTFMASEIAKVERRLRIGDHSINRREDIDQYWRRKLHTSVDGFGLRESSHCGNAHRWIREPTRLLSGRDFVNIIKVRINALPTRSRTTRGRENLDRLCRAGCQVPETSNHVVQQCHRTHAERVRRHDNISKFLKRNLETRGYSVGLEPRIRTSDGVRKPDMVGKLGRTAIVLDVQVVTDGRSTDEAHRRKVDYYSTAELQTIVKETYDVDEVQVTSCTLNWRGIWSRRSVDDLLRMNILRSRDTALISTRVAIGTTIAFRSYNQRTNMWRRTGIG